MLLWSYEAANSRCHLFLTLDTYWLLGLKVTRLHTKVVVILFFNSNGIKMLSVRGYSAFVTLNINTFKNQYTHVSLFLKMILNFLYLFLYSI
jgi:hypothetical protein